jgi:hypothetical protein
MSVTHDFECAAHGVFEARVKGGQIPRCPKGCSKQFVKLVRLCPPGVVGARTRTADKLLREAAAMQGLSDISTSPSRPGGSVAQRNRMRNGGPTRNQDLHPAAQARAEPLSVSKALAALTVKESSTLAHLGFGHEYNKAEWKKDDKTGVVRHVGAPPPRIPRPTGSTGVSVERVKE